MSNKKQTITKPQAFALMLELQEAIDESTEELARIAIEIFDEGRPVDQDTLKSEDGDTSLIFRRVVYPSAGGVLVDVSTTDPMDRIQIPISSLIRAYYKNNPEEMP